MAVRLQVFLFVALAAVFAAVLLWWWHRSSDRERKAAAHFKSGCALHKAGKYAEACEQYAKAVELKPDLAQAYMGRAMVHFDLKDDDKAVADFTEAIRLNPKDAFAHYKRATAYERKGEKVKAEADFAKAKELGYEPE
jgi:Tfp pilus assembly protein PilF